MGWKRVAWAGCLAPVLGGCHTAPPFAPGLASGQLVAHTQAAIEHEIRKDAREAWREVRGQYPRRCFTAEFRDGFLDGYTDYLDRGGDAQPPAVPPLRYTRHSKYFTPEGHALIKDYFLGFKYGVDVAVATGQRQYLTVPVLVPEPAVPHGPVVAPGVVSPAPVPPSPPSAPAPMPAAPAPLPAPRPLPVEKTPAAPGAVKATTSPTTAKPKPPVPIPLGKSKFDFGPTAGDPDATVSAPAPSVPDVPVPALNSSPAGMPALPAVPTIRLPEPPAEVPSLPPGVPTPPATDDLPMLAPNHSVPPPLPANHPEPDTK